MAVAFLARFMGDIVADQVLAEYIEGCFVNLSVEIVVPAHQCRRVVVRVCGFSIRAGSRIHEIISFTDSPKHLMKEADRQVPLFGDANESKAFSHLC